MSNNPVVIGPELSGSGDVFINPDAINEIHCGYETVTIILRSDSRVDLKPVLEHRKTAKAELFALLFTPQQIEKMEALATIMRRSINVDAVECIAFRSGLVWANMRDGSKISSRPAGFHDYRRAVMIVHGPEAAARLKPSIPDPIVLEQKPRPSKPQPAKTTAEWYDGLTAVTAKPQPIATGVVVGPPLRTSDPLARAASISGVIDALELHCMELDSRYAFASSAPQREAAASLSSRVHKLRMASAQLAADDTIGNLEYVGKLAAEVAVLTGRLPRDEFSVSPIARIIAECSRLSSMRATSAAA